MIMICWQQLRSGLTWVEATEKVYQSSATASFRAKCAHFAKSSSVESGRRCFRLRIHRPAAVDGCLEVLQDLRNNSSHQPRQLRQRPLR